MRRKPARIPRILSVTVFLLVVFVGAFGGTAFAASAQGVDYSSEEIAFIQILNEYRADQGLETLLVSDAISKACDRHSSDMAKYRFFSHYSEESDWFAPGASPWDRMAACGYDFNTYKGENIAAGYSTAAAVFAGWKSSPGHNANMLNPNYRVVGVSMVYVSESPYGPYWTTDFGGYVDSTAHSVGSSQPITTTTTAPPTTTTTTAPPTTTTTTTAPPTTTTTTTTTPDTLRPVFPDVDPGTLYAHEIRLLAERGVICGYGDGTFRPAEKVIRQQFAKMIVLALGWEVPPVTACAFKDVAPVPDSPDPLYPAGYIAACVAQGITVGKTSDTFGPYDHISRAQLVTMVARAAGLAEPPAEYRPPFENFDESHYPWARRAAYAGLLDGLAGYNSDAPVFPGPAGSSGSASSAGYDFWAPATRGEVCLLLASLMGK